MYIGGMRYRLESLSTYAYRVADEHYVCALKGYVW